MVKRPLNMSSRCVVLFSCVSMFIDLCALTAALQGTWWKRKVRGAWRKETKLTMLFLKTCLNHENFFKLVYMAFQLCHLRTGSSLVTPYRCREKQSVPSRNSQFIMLMLLSNLYLRLPCRQRRINQVWCGACSRLMWCSNNNDRKVICIFFRLAVHIRKKNSYALISCKNKI